MHIRTSCDPNSLSEAEECHLLAIVESQVTYQNLTHLHPLSASKPPAVKFKDRDYLLGLLSQLLTNEIISDYQIEIRESGLTRNRDAIVSTDGTKVHADQKRKVKDLL